MEEQYFQKHMEGNICFGCGDDNSEGLQIKSYWKDGESLCEWEPEQKYQGWKGLMNGGIIATLIDCHCMGTAMAAAYQSEDRNLDSLPIYRYATGTLTVKYLKPTSSNMPLLLKAQVTEIKGKKVSMNCQVYSKGELTAEAQVIALRVFDSSSANNLPEFAEL